MFDAKIFSGLNSFIFLLLNSVYFSDKKNTLEETSTFEGCEILCRLTANL